jgi:hypothetical protein
VDSSRTTFLYADKQFFSAFHVVSYPRRSQSCAGALRAPATPTNSSTPRPTPLNSHPTASKRPVRLNNAVRQVSRSPARPRRQLFCEVKVAALLDCCAVDAPQPVMSLRKMLSSHWARPSAHALLREHMARRLIGAQQHLIPDAPTGRQIRVHRAADFSYREGVAARKKSMLASGLYATWDRCQRREIFCHAKTACAGFLGLTAASLGALLLLPPILQDQSYTALLINACCSGQGFTFQFKPTALPRRKPPHNQIGVSRPSANTSVPLPQKLTCPIVSSASPSGPGRVQAPSGTVVRPPCTLKYAASPLYGQ